MWSSTYLLLTHAPSASIWAPKIQKTTHVWQWWPWRVWIILPGQQSFRIILYLMWVDLRWPQSMSLHQKRCKVVWRSWPYRKPEATPSLGLLSEPISSSHMYFEPIRKVRRKGVCGEGQSSLTVQCHPGSGSCSFTVTLLLRGPLSVAPSHQLPWSHQRPFFLVQASTWDISPS